MEFLKSVGLEIKNSITPAVLAALLILAAIGLVRLFAKSWIDNWIKTRLARGLESYKDELRRDTERELETLKDSLRSETEQRLANQNAELEKTKCEHQAQLNRLTTEHKAELDKISCEHQIRFSKLHEKRAEVIADIYGQMGKLYYEFNWLANTIDPKKRDDNLRQMKSIGSAINELEKFFTQHAIYLDASISDKVGSFLYPFKGGFQVIWYSDHIEEEPLREGLKTYSKHAREAMDALSEEFRKVLEGE